MINVAQKNLTLAASLALGLFLASSAHAQTTPAVKPAAPAVAAPAAAPAADAKETVNIEAAEMEILDAEKKTIFRGDVVAKRSNETIRCPEMIITYVDVKQPDGTTKSEADLMDCPGKSTITTPTQKIVGDKAKLFLRKDELVVTGHVKVTEGNTVLKGPEFFTNTKTKRSVMKGGGGRVKGSFVP